MTVAAAAYSDDINRRITIQHEIASHVDWHRAYWDRDHTPDEHKALGLLHNLAQISTSVRTGQPNRKALLRVAGAVQAWIEDIDRKAAA